MKSIDCFVGQLGDVEQPLPFPLRLNGRDLAAFLNQAGASDGQGRLSVAMDYSRAGVIGPAPEANSFFLHRALERLTQNGPDPTCVGRIGLVLASRYTDDPKAFGYMFDTGFDPAIGDQSFNRVAREGCAIFLDAIRDRRAEPNDYRTEVGFTAIHELGHVFNLWHVTTPSFMAQSHPQRPFETDAFRFVTEHRKFLSQADSRFVCPGGSPFDSRGDLIVPPGDSFNGRTATKLRVRIGVRQPEFWRFEPVQLDVAVSVAPGVSRVTVPDAIDPGYDAFAIWIDAPDGTRRKYRSPVRYCDTKESRSIVSGVPFKRDIPIFGQSGGFTFGMAGIHRICCTFRLPDGSVGRSNDIEVYVKPSATRSAHFRHLSKLLTQRENSQTLFYRNAIRPSRVVEPLGEAARAMGRTPAAADTRYSLARSLVTASRARGKPTRQKYHATATRLLRTALDSGELSHSRERRAASILNEIEA